MFIQNAMTIQKSICINNLLIKLFIKLPRCSECAHYNKTCKVFGDIFRARTSDIYCGINAKYFEKKINVKVK